MEFVKLSLIGFVLGITAIIPGFSVATMAVVLNVYDRLINIIVPNVKKIIAAWMFWLPLVIGGVAGLLFFSKVFTILFESYNVPTYWFFIGVIIGSIPLTYFKACNTSQLAQKRFPLPSVSSVVCCIFAIAVMIFMAIIKPEEGSTVYTELTAQVFGMLAIAGALAAVAMIIPGISGAFILLVTGLYRTVLQSVSELNIMMLVPLVLGALIGLLASAAFVRFLLKKAPNETYGAVLGLVAGSVFVLYPGSFVFQTRWEFFSIIISVLCLVAGFTLSFIFSRPTAKNKATSKKSFSRFP